MQERFFVISEGVSWKEVNESIIIEPDFALNSTAAFIFKKITNGLSNMQIVDALSREYDANISDIISDVENLIQEMQEEEIIEDATLRN
ncbi:PqqD family protein [Serratia marcescens]|uniref:PqqD family protein n=2 Tax=Serratia TaxID=613 RepID=A0ABX5NG87_SERMA|nr:MULTISPECIES: PqqD family protein [Serratia]EME9753450.1 PqqD family protein [Serratia marcescens]KKO59766.1 coenzyme PQQ synthesis D family protein [Serratia ureilytica]MBX9284694.1 PqqD family protein [Serratia marcescens]MBX9289209.1 PqqD family protein [Serratia marcescens]MBX9289985.1 PqqD family protein [Serratia marcescens]